MNATVRALKDETPGQSAIKEEMPAVGVSLNISLGAGRALVIQTHVGQDDDIDGLLDRMLTASDRQKAKYEISEIEDELRRMKLMQGDRQRDLDRFKEGKELETIRAEGDQLLHAHTSSGRKGEFKFPTNYVQRLAAVQKDFEMKLKGAQIEFDRHTNEIMRLESEIEKRRKIVAGG